MLPVKLAMKASSDISDKIPSGMITRNNLISDNRYTQWLCKNGKLIKLKSDFDQKI